MFLQILQLIGIFITALFGSINTARLIHKRSIYTLNFILFAIGITCIFANIIF
jgi:hypothetical protein